MTKHRHSGEKHHTKYAENQWVDPRLKIILAPGAIANWPTRADNLQIEKEHSMARAADISEKQRLSKVAKIERWQDGKVKMVQEVE